MALLLFLCSILFFQQCKQPETSGPDPIFDSLVSKVNSGLKTNADSALQVSEVLFLYAGKKPGAEHMADAARLRGKAFELSGKNDSALKYYTLMHTQVFQLRDTAKMIQASYLLGSLFLEMKSNDSVAYWLRKGMGLAVRTHDTLQQARFLLNTGNYYLGCNQSDSAMQCFTRAALYYLRAGDSANLAMAYRNMGNLLTNQQFQRKAIPMFLRAIEINKHLGKQIDVGLDYSNMAIAYKRINTDSVYYYYKQAMAHLAESGSQMALMPVKFNYANYLKSKGKMAEAENIYLEVLHSSQENNILKGQIYSLNMLAKTAVIRKDQADADMYFEKALQLAEKNKLTIDILRLYNDRFEGYLALDNSAAATKYYTLWNTMNDSLQTSTQKDAIVKYLTLYETEKKNLEIKVLTIEHDKELLKNRYLIYIFIASLLIVLAFLYALWLRSKNAVQRSLLSEQIQNTQLLELNKNELLRINQEQEAMLVKQELDSNQKLLLSKMLLISHNSEFISVILFKVQALNKELITTDQQDKLNEIIKAISSEVHSKKWAEFQQQYHKSHEDFFKKLNECHPNLTAGEHRSCILLRMNLSVKEIAELTFQAPSAIEMARHRLRTKLNLKREENLTSYLSTF